MGLMFLCFFCKHVNFGFFTLKQFRHWSTVMRITMGQIEAAHDIASQVFDHKLTMETGANTLQDTFGLNINSARDFINDYRLMLHGKVFQRAMSAPAIDYFLMRIAADRGLSSLQEAIKAVHKHINYYEGIRKVNLHAMRTVVTRHEIQIATPIALADQTSAFNRAVKKALADSASNRQVRLQGAAKMPVKVRALTEIYLRNADVVAEVLLRASGVCQRCNKAAPFMRKKDGTPYLEVHHKKQLANGGEDTVENAIALCANCHRELHYGATR
jgi:5-methylcytosine-specific restriction protein A